MQMCAGQPLGCLLNGSGVGVPASLIDSQGGCFLSALALTGYHMASYFFRKESRSEEGEVGQKEGSL